MILTLYADGNPSHYERVSPIVCLGGHVNLPSKMGFCKNETHKSMKPVDCLVCSAVGRQVLFAPSLDILHEGTIWLPLIGASWLAGCLSATSYKTVFRAAVP